MVGNGFTPYATLVAVFGRQACATAETRSTSSCCCDCLGYKMPRCIFCKSDSGGFNTREHILPESLGGGDWAILPEGLLCDLCQNRFGSEVEQQAIGDYPFAHFRVFLGIPTKKGRAPWLSSWEGIVRASPEPGQIGYDPAERFMKSINEGSKTQIRLLAQPIKPQMICRTLLKMGLEVVASDDREDIFESRYDAARSYALDGKKERDWWYLQREDMVRGSKWITRGVSLLDWQNGVSMAVTEIDDGAEVFHLRLLYIDMIVPLDPRIQPPDMIDLREPEYRLFRV